MSNTSKDYSIAHSIDIAGLIESAKFCLSAAIREKNEGSVVIENLLAAQEKINAAIDKYNNS